MDKFAIVLDKLILLFKHAKKQPMMVIGEVWADTTTSATHPIYRISTVAT